MPIQVLLPQPFQKTFTYTASPQHHMNALNEGRIVKVPFGKKTFWGCIWPELIKQNTENVSRKIVLKSVDRVSDFSLSTEFILFLKQVSAYTMTPLGQALKMALSCPDFFEKETDIAPVIQRRPEEASLSSAQKKTLGTLLEGLEQMAERPLLLQGVTGSGKTEVYLAFLKHVIQSPSQQTLILLPEISLTPQWCQRFEKRFGYAPLLWHSHLTPKQRRLSYAAIIQGKAPVIVGARSALFLPYKNLKLIIVDEEHDSTFKQEEAPCYHARDMAVLRAAVHKCPVLLASATPSLESVHNVHKKKYALVKLESRYNSQLPVFRTIKPPIKKKHIFSDTLVEKLSSIYRNGGQSLLFLNRRGYAPFVRCKQCNQLLSCLKCDAGLVYHKQSDTLLCHLCGLKTESICGQCGGETSLIMSGMGIEKLQETLQIALPKARIATLSSDSMSPKRLQDFIHNLEQKKIDVVIGTQILAKGHHFPALQFVGVLGIDSLLEHFDFRAHERLYQLITQVGGRAGRAATAGEVWIQTDNPNHPIIQDALQGNYDTYCKNILSERAQYGFPPYHRMAALILSGPAQEKTALFAKEIARQVCPNENIHFFGPNPAPLFFVRGRYRYRFLLHAKQPQVFLQPFLKALLKKIAIPFSMRLQIDIDPYDFM